MRADMLASKTQQVQQELAAWAQEKGLLDVGEQLVFTLRIESTPTVVHDANDGFVSSTVRARDFFTKQRLVAVAGKHGLSAQAAIRGRNAVLAEIGKREIVNGTAKYLLCHFLRYCPRRSAIRNIPNMGKRSAEVICRSIIDETAHPFEMDD
jgi:hypothetical protein